MPSRDHTSEIVLLGLMALGVVILLVIVVLRGVTGWDVAACLLVLQSIISAVKERWMQRSNDRTTQQLGAAAAAAGAVALSSASGSPPTAPSSQPAENPDDNQGHG